MEPGLKLIKIFKEHSSKTCILDDFGFYEGRQKTIQEKKAKQQQFHKQVLNPCPLVSNFALVFCVYFPLVSKAHLCVDFFCFCIVVVVKYLTVCQPKAYIFGVCDITKAGVGRKVC